jgi:hypothetical protein
MKYIFTTIVTLLSLSCASQIINIKDKDGTRIDGAYYKDTDNELDQFVGTYQLIGNNGLDEMTIVFKKFSNYYNTKYYQDILVGEIKFKKDGILYFDNLDKINANYQYKHKHDIAGNSLMTNLLRPVCNDCWPNQFRADLIFFGNNNNCGGNVILQKIIDNGQEKMKVSFWLDCGSVADGAVEPIPFIPGEDFVLTKLP